MHLKIHSYCLMISWIISSSINFGPKISVRDFKKNYDLARNWGEKIFHDWHWNKLSNAEGAAINRYSYKSFQDINKYLIKTKGQLVNSPKEIGEKWTQTYFNEINQDIKKIDQGLRKISIPETIIVYRRVNEKHFNLPLNSLLKDDDKKIDNKLVEVIKNKFNNHQFIHYNFLSTSLVNKDFDSEFNDWNYPILMKIHVPKKVHGAYLSHLSYYHYDGELELLINRGYTLKYEQFTIINSLYRENLQIKVSLII